MSDTQYKNKVTIVGHLDKFGTCLGLKKTKEGKIINPTPNNSSENKNYILTFGFFPREEEKDELDANYLEVIISKSLCTRLKEAGYNVNEMTKVLARPVLSMNTQFLPRVMDLEVLTQDGDEWVVHQVLKEIRDAEAEKKQKAQKQTPTKTAKKTATKKTVEQEPEEVPEIEIDDDDLPF